MDNVIRAIWKKKQSLLKHQRGFQMTKTTRVNWRVSDETLRTAKTFFPELPPNKAVDRMAEYYKKNVYSINEIKFFLKKIHIKINPEDKEQPPLL